MKTLFKGLALAGSFIFCKGKINWIQLFLIAICKQISIFSYSSAKIADRILEGKILFEKVQKAAQYEEMIKPRLEALVHLKESLDNKFNLYSYMPRMYPFITGIKADYLISSHFSVDNFIFIIKANAQGELKCDFLCCSIFEI